MKYTGQTGVFAITPVLRIAKASKIRDEHKYVYYSIKLSKLNFKSPRSSVGSRQLDFGDLHCKNLWSGEKNGSFTRWKPGFKFRVFFTFPKLNED